MDSAMHITFRDIPSSPAVEERIRESYEKLIRHHNDITSCRVVVSAPHRHQHKGRTYQINIDLVLPGGELVVNRDHGSDQSHEDVYIAIRDAFGAAERQLKEYNQRLHHKVKAHAN
ncbi:MAG: HPF/RaiA family ribosome-associated protein [Myxococcota bacterium]